MIAIGAVILLAITLLFGLFCLMILSRRRWRLYYEMEAAKRADAAKTSFLSNMSHEMRTPMNAIIGMTEIVRLNMMDQNRIKVCIDKIHESSYYLMGIINDVLDMSKIEKEKMLLENSPFLISSVLDTALNLVLPQLSVRRHSFAACVWWKGSECLIGDEKRILQILVNILGNAVKYTPEGGDICLRVFCENDLEKPEHVLIRFEIEDNGIGMSHEYQSLIFAPFSQEKNSLSKGTGLGMAITAQMVHLMGGEISLKSELNKGSVFFVRLSLPIAMSDTMKESELYDKSVFLVEENKAALESAIYTLSDVGMQVDFAHSPDEALMILKQGKPTETIFLDSTFVKSAESLMKLAKKEGISIYQTGYGFLEDGDIFSSQTKGFLIKPILPSKLMNLMIQKREALDSDELQRSLEGVRILLAEDNELNAEIAIELLTHFGARVEHSRDGIEVCKRFTQSETGWYDLILMDIQMPKMNGYDAVRKIRALERSDASIIPIIAMTADAFSEDVARALEFGMNGHIAKPIDIQSMLSEIQQVLRKDKKS